MYARKELSIWQKYSLWQMVKDALTGLVFGIVVLLLFAVALILAIPCSILYLMFTGFMEYVWYKDSQPEESPPEPVEEKDLPEEFDIVDIYPEVKSSIVRVRQERMQRMGLV